MKIIFINLSSTWRGFEIAFEVPSAISVPCSISLHIEERKKVYDRQKFYSSPTIISK